MISALYTSESGMLSMQTGLDVIGYNIANVNTEAFKKNDVTFKDLLYQSYNVAQTNINPLQKGLGAMFADARKIMTQGSAISGSSETDLYISGNGFFVLNKDGMQLYSRLGRFRFEAGENSSENGFPVVSSDGNINYYLGNPTVTTALKLVNPNDGAVLQGWMADTETGEITSSGSVSNIEISEPYFYMNPKATTYENVKGTINAEAALSVYNSSMIKNMSVGGSEIGQSELSDNIELYGASTNNIKGQYNIEIYEDGSAVVTFVSENGLTPPSSKTFDEGSISTEVDENGEIVLTNLIPGLEITLKNDIDSQVKLTIDNSGKSIGDEFSAINTVIDSSGGEHSVMTVFTKISENTWKWKTDLINEETFTGTGNAQNFVLSNDINQQYPVTITANNGLVTRTIEPSQFYFFEDNKIITNGTFESNETITISYTDKLGNSRTEQFTEPEYRQAFVLDKNIDPETVKIFVGGNDSPLSSENYSVVGNKIIPVDLDGDGKSDQPFIYPGADIKITYQISPVSKSMAAFYKDEFPGSGNAENITLTKKPDSDKDITIKVVNNITGEEEVLSLSDFDLTENILSPKDTDGDGTADSPVINTDEKLVVEYSEYVKPVTLTENFTIENGNNAAPIRLQAVPDLSSIIVKVNGVEISADNYELGGNMIYPKDTDGDGIRDSFGSTGDIVEISYDIVSQTEGIITFDAIGNVIGGSRTPEITFNINTAAEPLVIDFDFDKIVQQAGVKDSLNAEYDGNKEGYLTKVQVYSDGTISGYYSNSETRDIAQIALATFTNSESLDRFGDSYFNVNANSNETAVISTAGTDSAAGVIVSNYLEGSNVDLSTEMTNMIIYQRAFQLDAKGIHTADEMLQNAINLKRS
ncbi:flagellar hook-basal body complex protein [Candidatus Dependentiae bacterium]|nr:flagellar hook-basal body complex protein [Candidatus Dependentiae bacterium]